MDEIFKRDEMGPNTVDPNWTEEQLLEQDGVFFLKDLESTLDINKIEVIRDYRKSPRIPGEAWTEIGVRKMWTHFIVRMKFFAPYYRKTIRAKAQKVRPEWDANDLLQQDGIFKMVDVAKKLPFSGHQLRHQAKQTRDSREAIGIWKEGKNYFVDMKKFRDFIRRIWIEDSDLK